MIFDNINEAYIYYINQLQFAPEVRPRGKKVKECLGISFSIANPRNRITNNTLRQMSLSFAFGEFLWYLRGSDKLDIIEYYSKKYPSFSDNKVTVNGAYGARIFGGENSQWDQVKNILCKDPQSRQAVITIHQPRDLFSSSLDIPCTCILQYFIRNGRLNGITYMRSNDIYLGMPYDIFSFTMLQEMLAVELDVDLGYYTHMVGSLHIYENNYNIFNSLTKSNDGIYISMENMTKKSVSEEQIFRLLKVESAFRKNELVENINLIDPYWRPFIKVLRNKNLEVYSVKSGGCV